MNDNRQTLKVGGADNLLDLFKLSQEKSRRNMNVATLAKVSQVTRPYSETDGYGIALISEIPRISDTSQDFTAYFFSDDIAVGNFVLCVFTDRDFRQNLKTPGNLTRPSANQKSHSQMFGVLINLTK